MKIPRIVIYLIAGAVLAFFLALLDISPNTGRDWFVYACLLAIGSLLAYGVWCATDRDHRLLQPALTAALLRLLIGVALMSLLPVVGYLQNPHHQAGYFYEDAFGRDYRSWELSISGKPLIIAFSGEIEGDQYGGMMFLSALLYRTFSLDAARPFLVLILNAAVAACGVFFVGYTAKRLFGKNSDQDPQFDGGEAISQKAAWMMALYPEAVLLGATHMREAYLIPLVAMSIFGLVRLQFNHRDGWAWLLTSGLLLIAFSPLAMLAGFAVLVGFWLLEPGQFENRRVAWKTLAILGLLTGIAFVLVLLAWSNLPSIQGSNPFDMVRLWISNNITYQSHLSERASGVVQELWRWVGPQWTWLVTAVYGVAQPVLPAVVGDPDSAWIMRLVGFFRGAGWYALALFLVYALITAVRARKEPRHWQLLTLGILLWAWIIFTALIGGGDQWDNPRYRTFLLPWMALLASWAWQWALVTRDRWLWRWFAVEAFFVLSFMEWYITRYTLKFLHLDIIPMIILNLVVAGAILGSGLIQWKKREVH